MEPSNVMSQQPDELLYHYTSIESFVSIITRGELWASHIRYMNDTSEQRLMEEHVRARIKTRLDAADGTERERLQLFETIASSPIKLDLFILCFSKDGGDRLSQWRGYGGGTGIALGFDPMALSKRCSAFTTAQSRNQSFPMGWALLNSEPVHYIEPSGDERTNKIIDLLLDNPDVTVHESRFTKEEAFARRVALSSSNLKHKAFQEEHEWRAVIFDLPDGSIKFRTRKSMMIPYVPFDLGRGEHEWPLIRRVIVGPNPHQKDTIAAIKKMLDHRIVVEDSSIPYRDW